MVIVDGLQRSEEFERVQSLTKIARVVLDVRILCCLLVAGWVMASPSDETNQAALLVVILGASAWLLAVLLRWQTFGLALSTHPLLLWADALLCLLALSLTDPLSPMLLLLGSGAVLTGLCLDRTGAWIFSPVLIGGWWLVLSIRAPESVEPSEPFVFLVVVPCLLVGALFLGVGIRDVVLKSAELEAEHRQQTRLAGIAEERARISREMHDSLVKTLQGVVMLADTLPSWVERNPPRAREQAQTISEQLARATRESRELVLAMRRSHAHNTLAEVLEDAVARWAITTSRVAVAEIDPEGALPTESTYELIAILNEALDNVARHTPDEATVNVQVHSLEGWVTLVVGDDGPGSSVPLGTHGTPKAGHFGILGIRERAARVGGTVFFESNQSGTKVVVRVPAALPTKGQEELK